ncbi:circadian clock KaiB family protein [Aquabacterium sp. CECT 9606]|uniref:circadian clock KaiB family protein n=1 Tax=Aquabacterium sp. CECT 9606 TaxID=2845822 RepID=UPI001E2BF31C|nr:circadian clock KaiB family protein [Aquabacterium sp. CECT 9606]CAH0348285.1 Circadian clock protein KaiB [Aquabacterium sp. CECT 9606]
MQHDEPPAPLPPYVLSLYISGTTPHSAKALVSIRDICEAHLPGRYQLEIIDILLHPDKVAQDQIIATPTLVKRSPLPVRRFIGDMSQKERILRGLGLSTANTGGEQ